MVIAAGPPRAPTSTVRSGTESLMHSLLAAGLSSLSLPAVRRSGKCDVKDARVGDNGMLVGYVVCPSLTAPSGRCTETRVPLACDVVMMS
jgi:hypothetical protein